MTETEDMETRVRKALSPILGVKPYVVIVDRSTLQDMHEDLWRLGVYTPEYQSPVTTCGLLSLAEDMMHVPVESDDDEEDEWTRKTSTFSTIPRRCGSS